MRKPSKILWFEPIFFLFFGMMHLSRIWGFFDRQAYANAWLGLMYGKGAAYYALMSVMALLCLAGIAVFILNRGKNAWWRWIYLFGGGYVLFDLFAIATGLPLWESLLLRMFDIHNAFWYPIWGFFILIGLFCFVLGLGLCRQIAKQNRGA